MSPDPTAPESDEFEKRLGEIRERWESLQKCQYGGAEDDGIWRETERVYACAADVPWLLSQVAAADEAIADANAQLERYRAEVAALRDERDRLRGALRFYAQDDWDAILTDGGTIARATLGPRKPCPCGHTPAEHSRIRGQSSCPCGCDFGTPTACPSPEEATDG